MKTYKFKTIQIFARSARGFIFNWSWVPVFWRDFKPFYKLHLAFFSLTVFYKTVPRYCRTSSKFQLRTDSCADFFYISRDSLEKVWATVIAWLSYIMFGIQCAYNIVEHCEIQLKALSTKSNLVTLSAETLNAAMTFCSDNSKNFHLWRKSLI